MQHRSCVWKRFGTNLRHQNRREFLKVALLASIGIFEVTQNQVNPCFLRQKFRLGETVMRRWVNDDVLDPRCGQTIEDVGVVVGMVYGMPGISIDSWVYWVKWHSLGIPTVSLPSTDYALESELENSKYLIGN